MQNTGSNTWAPSPPFFIDAATRLAFYHEITFLSTSSDQYEVSLWNHLVSQSDTAHISWTVRLGDAVAIHVPGKGHSLSNPSRSSSSTTTTNNQHHPFRVPWWTGEVVSIHRLLNDIDETSPARPDESLNCVSNLPNRFHGQYILEIRWFYTPHDIPGETFTNTTNHVETDVQRHELLETDQVHDIPCTSLLAPIHISESSEPLNDLYHSLQFYCIRGWSVHRKTLVPTGTLENRHYRGMMFSKYLSRGTVARSQWEQLRTIVNTTTNGSSAPEVTSLSWTQQYLEAIQKLSLTDASADIQADGIALTGREKEQEQICNFLRSAIRSTNDSDSTDANHAFSLFIAGAPGTGKTASARFIISRLRKEQADGHLPPFRFVSLNGMEMRQPFESYVRLWELLSTNKEKRSPGEAAARLEAYFGSSCGEISDEDDNSVEEMTDSVNTLIRNPIRKRLAIVCLVDEIDYLVTNKQTVVYNLFDWPVRGFIANSKAQLIVLGISNTLNLPERLHPRVSSRLGRERCIFRAYNVDESVNILKCRLAGFTIFQPDAIIFAARKTAAESGDIRKAFSLCKVAAEMVLSDIEMGKRMNDRILITIADIQKAGREMFGTLLNKAVSNATALEALLLVSLASLKRQSTALDDSGIFVNDVLVKMESVSRGLGDDKYLPPPSLSELLGMLSRFGELRVVTLSTPNGRNQYYGTSGLNSLVFLQMEDYEVLNCFKDTPHCALAEKYLARS